MVLFPQFLKKNSKVLLFRRNCTFFKQNIISFIFTLYRNMEAFWSIIPIVLICNMALLTCFMPFYLNIVVFPQFIKYISKVLLIRRNCTFFSTKHYFFNFCLISLYVSILVNFTNCFNLYYSTSHVFCAFFFTRIQHFQ